MALDCEPDQEFTLSPARLRSIRRSAARLARPASDRRSSECCASWPLLCTALREAMSARWIYTAATLLALSGCDGKQLNVLVSPVSSTVTTHCCDALLRAVPAALPARVELGLSRPHAAPTRRLADLAHASFFCQFFAVDDLRYQLGTEGPGVLGPGCPLVEGGGCEGMITPHTDALARESLLLEKNYVQQAVCSPTRTSLLTGRRPDATQVWDLYT